MRRLKTGRRPPIYPKTPGHLPCSSLTHPLPLPSRRPSVSFGGFGFKTSTVSPAADLSAAVDHYPGLVLVGSHLTYTLTVTNYGPSDATGVVITDVLPQTATFVSASEHCVQAGGIVTCELGHLARGGKAAVTIVVAVNAAGELVNAARVASDAADPSPENNAALKTSTVSPAADLVISSSTVSLSDGNLKYTLKVTNRGPSKATQVVLTNSFGSVNVVSSTNDCTDSDGVITCNLGSLGRGYVNRCVNDIRRRPSQPLIQWRFHPHTVHRDRRLRSTQGPSDA